MDASTAEEGRVRRAGQHLPAVVRARRRLDGSILLTGLGELLQHMRRCHFICDQISTFGGNLEEIKNNVGNIRENEADISI